MKTEFGICTNKVDCNKIWNKPTHALEVIFFMMFLLSYTTAFGIFWRRDTENLLSIQNFLQNSHFTYEIFKWRSKFTQLIYI